MLDATSTTTTVTNGVDRLAFTRDDATMLDRWIDDVCGEELQFPAHRRSQFETYKRHMRQLRSEAGQTFFRNATRSGTREILALQNMIAALKQLKERDSLQRVMLQKEIESTERVLEEMHTVLVHETATLLPPLPPPPLPPSSGNSYGPYQTMDAESLENTAAYESHRKLAERYIQDLERQRQTNREQLEQHRMRYKTLLDQGEQLQLEVNALQETEKTVVERFDEVNKELEAERALLEKEKAAWEERQRLPLYIFGEENSEISAMNTLGENEQDKTAALRDLRLTLTNAHNELTQAQTALDNAESSHTVRFRQSRQRLKDWQDMVEHMRRTYDQLSARTGVIGKVVETNASRLQEESGNSYLEQLRKLNQLLIEKTATTLGFHKEEEEEEENAGNGVGAEVRELFVNQMQTTPSVSTTDDIGLHATTPRRLPSLSSTSTTTMGSSVSSPIEMHSTTGIKSQTPANKRRRHRRPYALLTYLHRWEAAITSETSLFLSLCEKGIGSTASPPSSTPQETIQQIRKTLLMA
ncbi:uncharacterized protein TM35_000251260 [Trypanosoma theileri]|uniref:Uncharacterized protein n=1 Tax=Trypanosoma theileri TaxID=67003 RepID=A0A1X0NRT9_9TRYP|nr:uncharacterized protein TM35_000251260 [Trypanosoma theileri]ORC86830.1 hypothetical protein TM35_000251260 [Trypanosoma theileri]